MQPRSSDTFDQPAVNMLYATPTVHVPLQVRNYENPYYAMQVHVLHQMREEAVRSLDLTKHDVIHLHHVGGGDGRVGSLAV